MAVPAPPMSRATSSQHPATTASATADGAVAGGDALLGDDDAPDAPRQEAEEAVVKPAGMMSCSSCQSLSAELSEFLLYTWAEHFMTANGVLLGSRHSLHNLPRRPGGCV
eukprot:jgi/Tetstr1/426856/TSEL_017070.t1